MPLRLHKLNLSHFRNYETLRLAPDGAGMVVLTGVNGSGKTNILEAVSLLSPGRGLRGAPLPEMQGRFAEAPFAVSAEVETDKGALVRIGTGLKMAREDESPRRVFRLNGRDVRSQQEFWAIAPCLYLTPQMDRLFTEGTAARRRFLDRLVQAFDPEHAGRVSRMERNLRERLKVLQDARLSDPQWLDGLEAQLAADFSAVCFARLDLAQRLETHASRLSRVAPLFPAPQVSVAGSAEALFAGRSALEAEEEAKGLLKAARARDAAQGRTEFGAHRSDMEVVYAARAMPAAQCSTGEQKGLLVAIILAHALMMRAEKGFTPLLLLDEVAAHLDEQRRAQLFEALKSLDGQVWLTGTDEAVFAPLKKSARFYAIADGHAAARPRLGAAS